LKFSIGKNFAEKQQPIFLIFLIFENCLILPSFQITPNSKSDDYQLRRPLKKKWIASLFFSFYMDIGLNNQLNWFI